MKKKRLKNMKEKKIDYQEELLILFREDIVIFICWLNRNKLMKRTLSRFQSSSDLVSLKFRFNNFNCM